jgi:glycosyltransferase involved in cell wall biosynthesis
VAADGGVAWHILTGEYPTAVGGVADYTRGVARGLAREGEEVHVWAPTTEGGLAQDDGITGITTHALPNVFGPRSLVLLGQHLSRSSQANRLLVQYVPHAFGMKAMNVPFCAWIAARRREDVWVMFHEVAFPWGRERPWRHNLLGGINLMMASALANRADRTFVSCPAWNDVLGGLFPRPHRGTWLPIPTNMPLHVRAGDAQRVRARIAPARHTALIGHFGTYGSILTPLLSEVLRDLLAVKSPRTLLLLGRGGAEFARAHLRSEHVVAPGSLSPEDIAAHLAACDLVVQPFVDGVSSRRTSVMASLALGVPVVTNEGHLSEDLWRSSDAVALAPTPSASAIAATVEQLLSNPDAARALGARGKALYDREFSLERTIAILRGAG